MIVVGVREQYVKVKNNFIKNKVVIANSHPDQWGFWEWLGQTLRLA
jgi:hypothetical protein